LISILLLNNTYFLFSSYCLLLLFSFFFSLNVKLFFQYKNIYIKNKKFNCFVLKREFSLFKLIIINDFLFKNCLLLYQERTERERERRVMIEFKTDWVHTCVCVCAYCVENKQAFKLFYSRSLNYLFKFLCKSLREFLCVIQKLN
jgi:hypothetical protein